MLAVAALAVAACGKPDRESVRGGSGGAAREAAASASARPADAGRRTIMFMGTSLTAGYGLDPDSAFTSIVQRRIDSLGLKWDVVNAGVSGETSAGALRRIHWVMHRPVNVFVLESGANDGLRALSVDSLRANLQAIIDSVRQHQPRARIVLVGMEAPPNLGARYASAFHAVYPELAKKNHLPLIPFLLAGVAGVDTLNQGDGIHPNARGERIVASTVWRTVGPMLEGEGSGSGVVGAAPEGRRTRLDGGSQAR